MATKQIKARRFGENYVARLIEVIDVVGKEFLLQYLKGKPPNDYFKIKIYSIEYDKYDVTTPIAFTRMEIKEFTKEWNKYNGSNRNKTT